jgi:hypothetical protein
LPDCQFDCGNASIALSFPPNTQIGNWQIGNRERSNLQSEIFNLKWQQIPPFFMIRMGVAGGESSELISFSQS